MKIENIPIKYKNTIEDLQNKAYTIQCDINDSIEEVSTWEEAKKTITDRMNELQSETNDLRTNLDLPNA